MSSGEVKKNYDIGRNENEVNLKISPKLAEWDSKNPTGQTGITLKVKEILPKGLTYVSGSSNYDEPEIIENDDGTTTLIWNIYNCTVGEEIEPVTFKVKIDEETANGTQYVTTAIIEPDEEKIGLSALDSRTATYSFQVTNLASHRLYKETDEPIVEANGMVKYHISYKNNTDQVISDFQLLDILPYNGDNRGTSYTGNYVLDHLEITSQDGLKIYTTASETVRGITAKDEGIGTDSIWKEVTADNINEEVVAFALKGSILAQEKVDIDVYLKINGNTSMDTYVNNATAQIDKETEELVTTNVKVQVIKRKIEGKVWFDKNKNGIIDEEEKGLANIKVILLNADSNEVIKEIQTKEDGSYVFDELPKGNYKVEIEYGEEYKLTEKQIGSNDEINSKFNSDTKSTDTIIKLNGLQTAEIIENNVNAGLIKNEIKINVTATKKWVDTEEQKDKRPASIIIQLKSDDTVVDSKEVAITTKKDECEVTFENLPKYDEDNNIINYTVDETVLDGTEHKDDLKFYEKEINGTTITNTFTKPNDKISITVNKEWVDTNNVYEKRPLRLTLDIKNKATEEVVKEGMITVSKEYSYTFTNLDKYDENGNEIQYTADEQEVSEGDLFNYTKEVGELTTIEGKTDEKEITITNTLSKIPGTVVVKYVDKASKQEIADNIIKEGVLEETFDVTEDKKEVPGYTLIEEPTEKTGKYTEEEQVKIYYYAKDTKVIVKYLEKGTNKILTPETQYEINGYEGKTYTTERKNITGYTYVESTENTKGTMTREEIEVIYYYAQNTKVIVNYLEKDTNKVLANQEEIAGYEGKEYSTEIKTIDGYTYVESTDNTKGIMTKDTIIVNYYYAQNTKATVQYIDRETGKVLKEESKDGKVGDIFETKTEDFEGYVLVESPENPNIVMTKEEQIIKYYYAHVSAGVIEKHIDEITGELLYNQAHKGNEGDEYSIQSKTFEGYGLVIKDEEGNSKLPTNAEGKMKQEVIEVKYYYIKKASVRVEYIDKLTGEKLTEDEIKEGHENESYTTEAKDIADYVCVEKTTNAEGKMIVTKNEDGSYNTETIVKYYYIKKSAGVIEKHIDIKTNKGLAEEKHEGKIGDSYNIGPRTFDGYEIVESKLPSNSKGTMKEELIEVDYYYIKKSKVIVEYIDKQTGEKLDTEEITGYEGNYYEAEDKQFDRYDLVEIPNNKTGKMQDKEITVKYYYEKKAEVEVKYLEKGTENPVAESQTIQGHIGDKYQTEKRDIEYYRYVESTSNTKGNMSEEKTTVIYYYEKQIFNLKVDKWISNVTMDGISVGGKTLRTKDELSKIDISRNKVTTADVRITYKISVTNTGEIEGKVGRITEIIPSGYSYYQEDNKIIWENTKGMLITTSLQDEIIEAGKSKEIEITLRWDKGDENFGEKNNIVVLSKISNPAGYKDINKEDNSSEAKMLISIATGLDSNDRIIIIGIVQIALTITIGALLSYKKKEYKQ